MRSGNEKQNERNGSFTKFMRDKGNPDSAVSARETTPSDPPGRWTGRSRNSRPRHPLILQVAQTDDPKTYLWSFGSLDPSMARNPATPPSILRVTGTVEDKKCVPLPSGTSGHPNDRRRKIRPRHSLIFRTVDSGKAAHETLWSFGSLERSTATTPPKTASDPSGHYTGPPRKTRVVSYKDSAVHLPVTPQTYPPKHSNGATLPNHGRNFGNFFFLTWQKNWFPNVKKCFFKKKKIT